MTSEGDRGVPGDDRDSRRGDHVLSRDDALNLVRTSMSAATGLLPVSEAAALSICSVMAAWETTVTLIDGHEYWDIVVIRQDPGDWARFPDLRYPLASYPTGTERVLAGRGFFTSDTADDVMVEYGRQFPHIDVGSMMSVPIVARGQVHGEIFLVRQPGARPFGQPDLDLCLDLATLFGARLPALVTAYFEQRGGVAGSPSLPDLTRELDDPVD